MKKIIIVNDLIRGGGVESVLKNFVNGLPKNNFKIIVLTVNQDINSNGIFQENIKYRYLYASKPINSRLIRLIRRIYLKINYYIIMNQKYDVAIAFKEGPCMKFVSNLNATKKIGWVHVDYNIFHWTKYLFNSDEEEMNCMKRFNNIVCVSQGVKESIIKTIGNTGNLCVKYNPINKDEIIRMSKEAIVDIEKNNDKLLIVTVGRLDYQKGYDRLLKICNKINRVNNNYELWIIGEGEEKSNLHDYININKMDNVKLLGNKSNPYKYMAMADWFICPSRSEGYGMVLREAGILGIPILSTECSGTKEFLGEKSEYGIVVNNSDEALQKGLISVLDNKELRLYYKDKIIERSKIISLDERVNDIVDLF